MKDVVLFAFNGEMMCFVHVLLNALDMKQTGMNPRIIFEGASTKLAPELMKQENPFNHLYLKARETGLIEGVCKACSAKMGVLAAVQEEGLPLLDDMAGHPSVGAYLQRGFEVITF